MKTRHPQSVPHGSCSWFDTSPRAELAPPSKTLILGLGNPILSDDGVGLVVAGLIQRKMRDAHVLATPVAGIGLLDLVVGYEYLFAIDAFLAEGVDEGELRALEPAGPEIQYFPSHGFDLLQVLKVGKALNLPMPELLAVYGIVISPDPPFGENLSAGMRQKAEALAEQISRDIRLRLGDLPTHRNSAT